MKKIINLITICLFILFPLIYAEEIPIADSKSIYFPASGKTVYLNSLKKGNMDITLIKNKVKILNKFLRVIHFKEFLYLEEGRSNIKTYDFNGQLLSATEKKFGIFLNSLVVMTRIKKIFYCPFSNYEIDTFISDWNGNIIKEIQLETETHCKVSDDEVLIWMYSKKTKNTQPYTLIKIYNNMGELLKKIQSSVQETVTYKHTNNKKYILKTPLPDMPG